jgi:hypothetical protein
MSNSIIKFLKFLNFEKIQENDEYVLMKRKNFQGDEITAKIGWTTIHIEDLYTKKILDTNIDSNNEENFATITNHLICLTSILNNQKPTPIWNYKGQIEEPWEYHHDGTLYLTEFKDFDENKVGINVLYFLKEEGIYIYPNYENYNGLAFSIIDKTKCEEKEIYHDKNLFTKKDNVKLLGFYRYGKILPLSWQNDRALVKLGLITKEEEKNRMITEMSRRYK